MKVFLGILLSALTLLALGQKNSPCLTDNDTLQSGLVYTFPTKFPRYGDDPHDFYKYMQRNFFFKQDKENPIYTIKYTFVVDTSGAIKKPCITNNLDNPNYSRLLRALDSTLTNCPKWAPGIIRGQKINTRMTSIIHIRLN